MLKKGWKGEQPFMYTAQPSWPDIYAYQIKQNIS